MNKLLKKKDHYNNQLQVIKKNKIKKKFLLYAKII